MIYLDAAATAPTSEMVQNAISTALSENWGNISGGHAISLQAKNMLEDDREKIANLLKTKSENLVFTSGATEALNIVVQGFARKNPKQKIFYSAIEHDAVYKTIQYLAHTGYATEKIHVDSNGVIKRDFIQRINDGDLICVMPVNNETGVVNDVVDLANEVHGKNGLLLVDSVQSIYVFEPSTLVETSDFVVFSGHKLGAPQGVGLFYAKDKKKIEQLNFGGAQEWELRPGTIPAFLIHAFRLVLEELDSTRNEIIKVMNDLKQYAVDLIHEKLPESKINCEDVNSSPHIISIDVFPIESQMLVAMLSNKGICISKGSACASGASTPSRVLLEMGIEKQRALSTVRLSFLPQTTEDEIAQAVSAITETVTQLNGGALG